jgi:glutamine amidotransferase
MWVLTEYFIGNLPCRAKGAAIKGMLGCPSRVFIGILIPYYIMCRIFLSKNTHPKKTFELLTQFIDHTLTKIAHTDVILNGFGVAWHDGARWHTRKIIFPTRETIINMIILLLQIAPKNAPILCHIRIMSNNPFERKNTTRENTHPFLSIDGSILIHHGLIKDFNKHRTLLMRQIAPEYKKYIQGTTDTELIFYMLISFDAARDFTRAFRQLLDFFHKHKIAADLNIIYGTPDGRTFYARENTFIEPKSRRTLYASDTIVSTMKLAENQQMVRAAQK